MKKLITAGLFYVLVFSTYAQVSWQVRATFAGTARNHAISFSYGSKGYVMTGHHNGSELKDFWEYNSVTDTWTQLPDYPGPARSYGVGYVIDKKAYIGFGHSSSGFLKDFWEYDFTTSKWTQKGNFPGAGRDHPCCEIANGKLYMGFGDNNTGNYNDWWEYDPATDKWTSKTKYTGVTMHHPVAAHINGKVFVCEGHQVYGSVNRGSVDTYFYDPKTDSWEKMADMPGKGVVAGACFALGNKIYAGVGIEEPIEIFHNEFYEYDVAKDTWKAIANYPGTGTFSPVTFVIDNDGYLVTGASKSADTKNCYRLRLNNVGVDEINSNTPLQIYPNISSGIIKVEATPNERISIFSADGRLVHSYIQQTKQADLNVEPFASGLYLIQSGNTVKKFVRE